MIKFLIVFFSLFIPLKGVCQLDSIVRIANWKNNKASAIVFTFDDWSPGHGSIVYPILKKNNIPGTFFITMKDTLLGGGWEVIKQAYQDGYEIANHTQTHASFFDLDSLGLVFEILKTQQIIRSKLGPKSCQTIAYPYGQINKKSKSIVSKSHISGRIASSPYGRKFSYSLTGPSPSYYEIPVIGIHEFYGPNTLSTLGKLAERDGGMLVLMYHSVYNDTVEDKWFQPIHESMFQAHVKAIKKYKETSWITTYEKAVKYHKRKHFTELTIQELDNGIELKLKSDLNDTVYDEGLSLLMNLSEPLKKIIIDGVELTKKSSPNQFEKIFGRDKDPSIKDKILNLSPGVKNVIIYW